MENIISIKFHVIFILKNQLRLDQHKILPSPKTLLQALIFYKIFYTTYVNFKI